MNLDRLWFRSPPDLVPDESRSDLIWIYTGFGFEKTTHLHVHTKLIRCLLRYMEAKIIKGIVFSLLQVIHIHCLHQFINHQIILGLGQKTIHLRLRQWQNNLNRQKGSLQKTILRATIDNVPKSVIILMKSCSWYKEEHIAINNQNYPLVYLNLNCMMGHSVLLSLETMHSIYVTSNI
ncbi:hypothetical protein L2E82_44340 [Cichorium intybus]|uniref:Uncharacterized protein n=1 Tax=Cichorium intybus TaxID=13427 RepID=A0ACB8ZRF4_CICIN|nr:hypothetical protein L2E82_44340 [Cichorium intybus]